MLQTNECLKIDQVSSPKAFFKIPLGLRGVEGAKTSTQQIENYNVVNIIKCNINFYII